MKSFFTFLSLFLSIVALSNGIDFETKFNKAFKKAKAENKMVFIDVTAQWCGPCKKMEANVFSNVDVGSFFNDNFINLQIDEKYNRGIIRNYKIKAFPTLMFLTPDKKIIYRASGAMHDLGLLSLGKSMQYFSQIKDQDRTPEIESKIISEIKTCRKQMRPSNVSSMVNNLREYLPQYDDLFINHFGSYVTIDKNLKKRILSEGTEVWDKPSIRDQLALSMLVRDLDFQFRDIPQVLENLKELNFSNLEECKIYLKTAVAFDPNKIGNIFSFTDEQRHIGKDLLFKYPQCHDENLSKMVFDKFFKENKSDFFKEVIDTYTNLQEDKMTPFMYDRLAVSYFAYGEQDKVKPTAKKATSLSEEKNIEYAPSGFLRELLKILP